MTPLPDHKQHLYHDAVWIVVDPWQTHSERDNYVAEQIYQYIKHHNITNVKVLNNHRDNTHHLFEEFELLPYKVKARNLNEKNVVFVGFHNGICVKNKGTATFTADTNVMALHNIYVKMDLVSTLPQDGVYDFYGAYSSYGEGVQLI